MNPIDQDRIDGSRQYALSEACSLCDPDIADADHVVTVARAFANFLLEG